MVETLVAKLTAGVASKLETVVLLLGSALAITVRSGASSRGLVAGDVADGRRLRLRQNGAVDPAHTRGQRDRGPILDHQSRKAVHAFRGVGVHNALDQVGAVAGPLVVAGIAGEHQTCLPEEWCDGQRWQAHRGEHR